MRYCVILLLLCARVLAQPFCIEDSTGMSLLGKYLFVYEDKTAAMSLEQVRNEDAAFVKSSKDIVNFNVSHSAFWCRLDIVNKSRQAHWYLEQSVGSAAHTELYVLAGGRLRHEVKRQSTPFSERKPATIYPSFVLDLAPDSACTVYFRLMDSSPFRAEIRLLDTDALLKRNHLLDLVNGIYTGIMLIMLLYNVFIYFSVKERAYIYYAFYIVSAIVFISILTGYIAHAPSVLLDLCTRAPGVPGALFGISAMLFTYSFLNLKRAAPRWLLYLFYLLMGLLFVVAILAPVQPHESILLIQLLGITVCFFSVASGVILWRRNHPEAKYYLVAWGAYTLGIVIYILSDVGVLPVNLFTHSAIQIGSVAEVILLSMALADKVSSFKKEKELAQENALASAQENERLIREQNVLLEKKVKERTAELEEQKELVEDKQVEILDSIRYARRIQRSLMAPERQIEKILQRMKTPSSQNS